MAKKKRKSYRRKTFSILNAVESFVYAEILMRGTTGSGVFSFFTGEGDIGYGPGETIGSIYVPGEAVGVGQISLNDFMMEPGLAIATISSNFKSNLLPMSLAAFTTSISFRVGKRLLRAPLASINRNLVKPALGAGIRI